MKSRTQALSLISKALNRVDSTIHDVKPEHTLRGYYGLTQIDLQDFRYHVESALNITITDKDFELRMTSSIEECIIFLTELTIENNGKN